MNAQQIAAARGGMGTTQFGGPDNLMDFYWYGAPSFTIDTATPLVSNQIQIDASADFLWIASTYQADIAAGALTESTNVIPLALLQIQDTGSQKNLSNIPIPLTTYAGDGKNPYRLLKPRLFAKNSTISLNWTNSVAAGTTYRIRFVMHGYKVYS